MQYLSVVFTAMVGTVAVAPAVHVAGAVKVTGTCDVIFDFGGVDVGWIVGGSLVLAVRILRCVVGRGRRRGNQLTGYEEGEECESREKKVDRLHFRSLLLKTG